MCGPSGQIGLAAGLTPLSSSTVRGPIVFWVLGSYSWIQMARWPRYSAGPGGSSLLRIQPRPSSSKNSEASMPPTVGSQTGSDHGPFGSLAVIRKLPWQSTQVLRM